MPHIELEHKQQLASYIQVHEIIELPQLTHSTIL